ncbi:MAG: glycosyltransferase family 9 protein [Thermonemataceae bacterium]
MRLLVFRFSAMGDVALLVPVIRAVLAKYPQVQIDLVTRPKFTIFFHGIERLSIIAINFDQDYKGVAGLFKLYRHLNQQRYDYLIDQHQNLRTTLLKFYFQLSGIKAVTINKGRSEKKALTRVHNKIHRPLPHTTERYLATFSRIGLSTTLGAPPYIQASQEGEIAAEAFLKANTLLQTKQFWLGIAPFAQHENKVWGLHKIKALLTLLPSDVKVFLFGGGKKECSLIEDIHQQFPQKTIVVAGKLPLAAELALIKKLDKMLTMDSSNMHLAALLGVPTISIWGATHPYAGFSALQQTEENIIQIPLEQLPCRPCSVFGNKPCLRGDKACMEWIEPAQVLAKVIATPNTN